MGRWLTPDPIGFSGGLNLYTAMGNDPVGKVDPEGLDAWDFARGAGKAIAAGAIVAGLVAASGIEIPVGVAYAACGLGSAAFGYNTCKLATGKEPFTGREIDVHEWDETAGGLVVIPMLPPAAYRGPASIGATRVQMSLLRGIPKFNNRGMTFAVHSDRLGFTTAQGGALTLDEVAAAIRAVPGYKQGMPVHLLSCEGKAQAQALANNLGADVTATSKGVGGLFPYPLPLGGPWETFKPR